MIGFWISAGAMVLMVALLLVQAMRRGADAPDPVAAEADLAVYRDQLTEVDRDQARGTLAQAEADRLRTEVQRRMLDADRARRAETATPASRSLGLAAGVVAVGLLGSAWIYWDLGALGYPDLPLQSRLAFADEAYQSRPSQDEAEAQQPPFVQPADTDPELAGLLDKLRTAVADRPDDLLGHTLLAQNETALGNYAGARKAQEVVVRLKGDAATVQDQEQLATLMVTAAGGIVTPQAEQALIATLNLDPRNGWARFYSGLMFAQIGRPDRTFALWEPLLREGPDTAPWIAPIRDRIAMVADAAGINYAPPSAKGPDAAAVAAASDMSAEDRQAMIKTMVAGLEERLMADGGSVEEWAKLVTSLGVLQEKDRAQAAYDKAKQVFAGKPGELSALQAAATQAGLTP